ncbi:MAG: hypothetical protein WB471_03505 [Nocardioides sp.]
MKRPSAPMVISVAALVVALGGTSYAAAKIDTKDIANGAVTSAKVENGTIKTKDLSAGARGLDGSDGADGADGADGVGRWALVETDNTTNTTTIVSQSGGFSLVAAYPVLPNTAVDPAPSNALRANGNVYIDSGEDLADNGIVASIALQNTKDLDGGGMGGRTAGSDANAEFSGEVTVSRCNFPGAVGIPTNCAPTDAQNATSFVVSPRNSDGSVTTDGFRKRFYVVITN